MNSKDSGICPACNQTLRCRCGYAPDAEADPAAPQMVHESLNRFRKIRDDMIWKQSALDQLTEFEALAYRLKSDLEVVGAHTSKSIRLPVICLTLNGNRFFLRDNFHDVNLCVLAAEPVRLPLSAMFEKVLQPHDWDWYMAEVAGARGCSWREWTDEQMDDPNLLKLSADAPGYTAKSKGEKERWIRRFSDPEWYGRDWSSAVLCWDGEFGPGVTMYGQSHPFAEGISGLVPPGALKPYAPGKSQFGLAIGDCKAAERMIRRICYPELSARNDAQEIP